MSLGPGKWLLAGHLVLRDLYHTGQGGNDLLRCRLRKGTTLRAYNTVTLLDETRTIPLTGVVNLTQTATITMVCQHDHVGRTAVVEAGASLVAEPVGSIS